MPFNEYLYDSTKKFRSTYISRWDILFTIWELQWEYEQGKDTWMIATLMVVLKCGIH